jgi:hypothetical protein
MSGIVNLSPTGRFQSKCGFIPKFREVKVTVSEVKCFTLLRRSSFVYFHVIKKYLFPKKKFYVYVLALLCSLKQGIYGKYEAKDDCGL